MTTDDDKSSDSYLLILSGQYDLNNNNLIKIFHSTVLYLYDLLNSNSINYIVMYREAYFVKTLLIDLCRQLDIQIRIIDTCRVKDYYYCHQGHVSEHLTYLQNI